MGLNAITESSERDAFGSSLLTNQHAYNNFAPSTHFPQVNDLINQEEDDEDSKLEDSFRRDVIARQQQQNVFENNISHEQQSNYEEKAEEEEEQLEGTGIFNNMAGTFNGGTMQPAAKQEEEEEEESYDERELARIERVLKNQK